MSTVDRVGMLEKVGKYQIKDAEIARLVSQLYNIEAKLVAYDKLLAEKNAVEAGQIDQLIQDELKAGEIFAITTQLNWQLVHLSPWAFVKRYKLKKLIKFVQNNKFPGGNLRALLQAMDYEKNGVRAFPGVDQIKEAKKVIEEKVING